MTYKIFEYQFSKICLGWGSLGVEDMYVDLYLLYKSKTTHTVIEKK